MKLIDFFVEHIENIECCENFGFDLSRTRSGKNVAHILPKAKFKSVATHDKNVLYLCSTFDRSDGKTGCHERYDSSWTNAREMAVFQLAIKRLGEFRDQVKETSKILFYFDD
jgi:hypothetical protein